MSDKKTIGWRIHVDCIKMIKFEHAETDESHEDILERCIRKELGEKWKKEVRGRSVDDEL